MKRQPTAKQIEYGGKNEGVLRRFLLEFFHYPSLRKAGFFTPEMKCDYYAQAERICERLGLNSIFEYRKEDSAPCHLSYAGERPKGEPFVTVVTSIWD